MFKKAPRPEVVSLRLSEERLSLLERRRAALAAQLGRPVSLSEAIFQLIEARAPDADRETSRDELLRTPTTSLLRIRKRWTAEHSLPAPEWDLLAHYIQIGAEEDRQVPPMMQPVVPSRESYLALVDAFAAVYEQRAAKDSQNAWLYFGNLDGYQAPGAHLSDTDAHQRQDAVRRLIAQRRDQLMFPNEPWRYPGNVGGCLLVAIRDEGVPSTRLDQILAPYWPVLWRLAARGHWIRHDHRPVREAGPYDDDVRRRFLLPEAASLGDVTLSFASAGPELVAQIALDGRRLLAMIHRYPDLVEFHAMLEAPADQSWQGRQFSAPVSMSQGVATRTVWFQRDVAIDFSPDEWSTLRDLVRQAWTSPNLQRWLQELALEYGEHG